ncbi:MAG TPA: hypothetical protein VG326_06860 [Tepidisphaeraceae bacterium]|nr:hypothetical protein [Tepidisphaeraceae bacterium]
MTPRPSADRAFQLRRRLLSRIGRRYQVASENVEFGGVRFVFTRIADPDRVLDEMAAEADLRDRLNGRRSDGEQLHLPYWAELWDSARGIGIHLAAVYTAISFGKGSRLQALDLGCGMGMAGTVAAALGADVVFADLEPPALLFARLNSLPWRKRVRTRQLNWQRDRLDRRFDLIIGADILYERAQWPFLEAFWRVHLAEGGQVLLGEPGRQTGDLFLEWIVAHGWIVATTEIRVTTRPRAIRIFTIKREQEMADLNQVRRRQ